MDATNTPDTVNSSSATSLPDFVAKGPLVAYRMYLNLTNLTLLRYDISGFGGRGVACWPLVPKFAGSNPAEAVGFFRAKKSSAHLPSEGK